MPTKSLLLTREPKWTISRPGKARILPPAAHSWIHESESITRRLRSYYHDAIKVKILRQDWQPPFLSERKLLKMRPGCYALTREVLLHADGKPLILARTLIPAKTIKAARRNLAHLGTRPLGEIIFSYPRLERLDMEFTQVEPSQWTAFALDEAHIEEAIWGRRTIYAIRKRPMLVNEFFLPELLDLI